MPHNRHVYHLISPQTKDLYLVAARSAGAADNPAGPTVRRLTRDEALTKARSQPNSFAVKISPCPCRADALSTYAEEHPTSLIADRINHHDHQED
jgi:hypothetical protein